MKINSRFFAWSIVLYPWLSIYGTMISGLTVGDLLLLIDCIYIAFLSRNGFKYKVLPSVKIHILFVLYCLISACFISFAVDINIGLVLKRFLKYILFIIIIIYTCKGACDRRTFYRTFTIFSRITCIAIAIQYIVFYSLHRYVEFKIPFLKYSNDVLETIDYTSSALVSFRPHSLFLEPAHFTYFISVYLAFVLFSKMRESKYSRIIEAIIVTACMVASVSSTAVIVAILIWGYYIFQLLFNSNAEFIEHNRVLIIIIIVVAAIIGFRFYMASPQLSYSLNRILFSQNEQLATSTWGRVDSGKDLVESLSLFSKVFGMGLGNLPGASDYLSSVYYILYCTGFVGIAIYIFWGIKAFFETSTEGKVVLIIFAAFCVSSPIIISGYIVLFNALIYLPELLIESEE